MQHKSFSLCCYKKKKGGGEKQKAAGGDNSTKIYFVGSMWWPYISQIVCYKHLKERLIYLYLSWQMLHMVVYEAVVNGSHKLREIIHGTCFGKLQEAG